MLINRRSLVLIALIATIGCGPQNPAPTTGAPSPPPPNNNVPSSTAKPSSTTTPKPEVKEKYKVEITAGKVSINGVEFPASPKVADLEKIFGKSSAGEVIRNAPVFWKSEGVKGLHTKSENDVISLSFHFAGFQVTGDPVFGSSFAGSVVIDGQKVTGKTDLKELQQSLKLEKSLGYTWSTKSGKLSITINAVKEVLDVTLEW